MSDTPLVCAKEVLLIYLNNQSMSFNDEII